MRGVQVKLCDPLRTCAIPERLRGVFTTRRYTNPRLPLPLPLRPGVLQAGSVNSSVSERPHTTVPVGLLRPGRQCCHSAASEFHQPSTTYSTSLPSQHLRPPCLFCRRSPAHRLELSPGFHQCRVFKMFA